MHTAVCTLLASAVAVAAVTSAVPGTAASPDQARATAKKDPRATSFAMRGWGYGTAVRGGKIPVGSGATANAAFGCTNLVGVTRSNRLVEATLPQLGTVSGIRSRAWTTREGRTVSAWARNTIGDIVLSDSPLGSLILEGVSTTARAYHDGTRFRTATTTALVKLRFKPPIGPAQTLALPKPGRPVKIPGVATVGFATASTHASTTNAYAIADGLKVELVATGTTVKVAHATAMISKGVRSGLFSGRSYGLSGTAAGKIVDLGQNPLVTMPCTGTGGKVRASSLVSADLGQAAAVGVARSEQMARQTAKRAWGFERSRVASISLGDGRLKVTGITGQVNVARSGKHLRTLERTIAGTSVGTVSVGGRVLEFPRTGVIQVPGLAKLEQRVTRRLTHGLSVVALRITLLDGSGAVIDLGSAQLRVRRPAR